MQRLTGRPRAAQDLAYFKRWRLDRHRGIDRSPVPVGPIRDHVLSLIADGLSNHHIAEVAHVSPTTICRVRTREQGTVQRQVAARILAVTPTTTRAHADGFVPAIGARRRIRALLAIGWTHQELHDRGGVLTSVTLHQAGEWISAAKHAAIVRLYDDLSMTPGPSQRTRRRAARAGYAPPLAWDDEDLDNPHATPVDPPAAEAVIVDEVAVQRARAGDLAILTLAEQDTAVAQLTAEGLSADQIACRLRVTERTVQRARARNTTALAS